MEAPPGGVDDMTKLSYLHEPGVLQNLRTRYELNEIYVSTVECELPFPFRQSKRKEGKKVVLPWRLEKDKVSQNKKKEKCKS